MLVWVQFGKEFAVHDCFFSCVHMNTVNELEVHLIRTSVFSVEITLRKFYYNKELSISLKVRKNLYE